MNKKLYEVMKIASTVVLPAFATFYVTLASSWGWGATEQVVATVTALATLLGILVKTMPPIDGTVGVIPGMDLDDPDKFDIDLRGYLDNPALVENQKVLRLAVTKKDHPPA